MNFNFNQIFKPNLFFLLLYLLETLRTFKISVGDSLFLTLLNSQKNKIETTNYKNKLVNSDFYKRKNIFSNSLIYDSKTGEYI